MASKQHQIKLTVSVGCISHNNQMTSILMFLPTMGGGGGGGGRPTEPAAAQTM